MSRAELINQEIQLKEDECCIIFDLGCYFPYANQEILTFDFSLGEEKFDDYKKNHRYPNHHYQTISKKYGRKVSKLGYPYVMKLDEQEPMLLSINVGIKDIYITLVFPVLTKMTKDKPICGLSLRYNFDKNTFCFISHEKLEDGGWHQQYWSSCNDDTARDGDIILNPPYRVEDSLTLIYEDFIEPCPSVADDLLIL